MRPAARVNQAGIEALPPHVLLGMIQQLGCWTLVQTFIAYKNYNYVRPYMQALLDLLSGQPCPHMLNINDETALSTSEVVIVRCSELKLCNDLVASKVSPVQRPLSSHCPIHIDKLQVHEALQPDIQFSTLYICLAIP